MIRRRIRELTIAAAHCVESMRIVKHPAEISQAVVKRLAQAACSERALYWTVDPAVSQPRVSASWGALVDRAPSSDWDIRYRTISLSQGNVARVWRSGKPLWSASMVLDTAFLGTFEAGPLSGVWFAVKTDSSVYAVIELLGRALESSPPDNMGFLEQLGYRLGYALADLRYGPQRGRLPWISPD